MFDHVPAVTIAGWFEDSEVTVRMLRTLARIGPGGMIIADIYQRQFRAVHSQRLDHADRWRLPVFGHGDLTDGLAHLDEHYGTWQELVAAVDCTALECLAGYLEDRTATRVAVIGMRQHLQRLGFDVTEAPSYHRRPLTPGQDRGPSVYQVRETYTDRSNPHITVTVKHAVTDADRFSLIKVYDRHRRVTGWPKKIATQFGAGPQAHRIRERVDAYLARPRT